MIRKFIAAATVAALTACSGSGEDVRVTLCKDLVTEFNTAAGKPAWDTQQVEFNGYEDMAVTLGFSGTDTRGTIACYYPYNAVGDTAMTLSDPASAHDTYPSRVTVNGENIDSRELAGKINRVLASQGRQAVAKSREALENSLQ